MAIIDPEGLFHGDRLAQCSNLARLYWPYFFLVSNGYGRLEINYSRIVSRAFATFRPLPGETEIMDFVKEYARAHLLFLYPCGNQIWGQWDCKSGSLPRFKTMADQRSPVPPEPAYQQWLKAYRVENGSVQKFLQQGIGGGVGVGGGVGRKEAASVSTGGVSPPLAELPLTIQAIQEFYQAPDLAFVHRLVQAVQSADVEPDDAQIAAALRATHRKGQRSKALWLTTVPELLKSGGSDVYRAILAEYHQ